MKATVAFWAVAGVLTVWVPDQARARVTKLKVATLMPRGTAWMQYLNRFKHNVRRRTANSVRFVFYAGGVAGDEKDVVRKMRMGQIQGAAVTSVGLGLVLPAIRILELPMLFKNYRECDYVRARMRGTFESMFLAKGYRMLAWAALGWVYFYTTKRMSTMAELQAARTWRWVDDPIVPYILKELGMRGVPLGVADVLPSLQTGMINAVYGMALSTLALQWHTRLKYVLDVRVDMAVGGIILKKKAFDRLSAAHQKVVLEEAGRLERSLNASSRSINQKSMAAMLRVGMARVRVPPAMNRRFRRGAVRVQNRLVGRLYPPPLLRELLTHLKQCRASTCKI